MPTQPWRKRYSGWVSKVGLEKLKASSSKALQITQPQEVNGLLLILLTMGCVGLHHRAQLWSRLCLIVQGNDWADLPAEVIEAVLDNLNEKDCWDCRLISSNWGIVVREYQCGLVIPVHPRTLWSQSSSFRQRQAQYPRTRFTLKLARPFDFGELAELLSATVKKVWVCKSALASERVCSGAALLTYQYLSSLSFLLAGQAGHLRPGGHVGSQRGDFAGTGAASMQRYETHCNCFQCPQDPGCSGPHSLACRPWL